MNIPGISAFYHDSAACLVRDGKILAAMQEERFTRKKHDARFPQKAIDACLARGGIKTGDLDLVAFYDKPLIKFERLLESYLSCAPHGLASFLKSMPIWIKQKLWLRELIKKELDYQGKIIFLEHHESHAASAFFPSPFAQAAFLTFDGVGEWATASYGWGEGNHLEIPKEMNFPNSLGLLYSALTYFTGFRVNSGEYKVMGLAPYGRPVYKDLILKELIDLKKDGSFRVNLAYFDYVAGLKMTSRKMDKLFGRPPRQPESKITQQDMDIARSLQAVTEEIVLRMCRQVKKETGAKNLCLAGGVALNCVANGKILKSGLFERLWIQPAAGDAGGALGSALFAWYQYLGKQRKADGKNDFQQGSYLGVDYSNKEIKKYLKKEKIPYQNLSQRQIPAKIADLINDQKVIGWFQGRMEFGPRALGSRSIIGDARSPKMQTIMNLKIKFRESFRPFAPSVTEEKASRYFQIKTASPYMLMAVPVKEKICLKVKGGSEKEGLERLKIARSTIPAVTHVNYSARLQTVNKKDNPLYHAVIDRFGKKYRCDVIINTSFNVRGEPIVTSPHDAYLCFMRTEMDYLLMGNCLIKKEEQKPLAKDTDWTQEFALD